MELPLLGLMSVLVVLTGALSQRVARQAFSNRGGCSQLADVVFLYDGSDSMTAEDYRQEQNFINNIIRGLDLDPITGIRAGAVVFDSQTHAVRLEPFKNFFQLQSAINNLPHEQGGTFTHLGIQVVRDIFEKEGRTNVPYILVLLTDGRSKNGTATLQQARLAKQEGIKVITIGIGTRIDETELATVATSPDLFLRVENFNALQDLTLNISKTVCPTTTTTTTTTSTTTTTTPPPPNPCDDCRFSNGIAYAPHETECYLFYHCVGSVFPGSGRRLMPYVKRCPWNQFWDQQDLTCKPAGQVDCPTDQCKETGVTSYRMLTACNGYWECNLNRTAVASCCGAGQRYVNGQCVQDASCNDQCPYVLDDYPQPTCTGFFQPYPADELKFMVGDSIYDCPPGLAFDTIICWCARRVEVPVPVNDAGAPICLPDIHLSFDNDFSDSSRNNLVASPDGNVRIVQGGNMGFVGGGAARFDGGNVTIWKYANDHLGERFAITFRYFEEPIEKLQTKPESLVANSGCFQRCTVAVTFDRGSRLTESVVETSRGGRKVAELQQSPSTRGEWKDVSLRYDGEKLILRVNGEIQRVDTRGYVLKAAAALQLGNSCAEFANFYGYIDEFKVFKECLPPL